MIKIILTTTTKEKKPGTKNAYKVVEVTTEEVTEKQHQMATSDDTCKWFRRLGGSESVTKAYTCAGYVPIQVISTSPDKQIKKVREYSFKWID